MEVIIYHNPRCSKSRATLSLLQERGLQPTVINYLENPPTPETLRELLSMLGMAPRQLMRRSEAEFKDLELDDPSLSEDQLIAAMVSNPRLIERPIVVNDGQARIGRPPESVLEII